MIGLIGGLFGGLLTIAFFGMIMFGDEVMAFLTARRQEKSQTELDIEREKTEQLRLQMRMVRDFKPPKDPNE